ncbi:hypothetical protein MASR2M15_01710 [Anaerolineales bacterium]
MIGKKFGGRYEAREHLGEGSTATVYKAFDNLLERDVALKVLLPHVKETTRKRFFQEATAAAHLNHANIMAIYDRGEDDGQHYLVTEYINGTELTEHIPSSPEVVVDLGVQIALALDYAHGQNVIHRDIKPANIYVTSLGQVKIMDLGLALPSEAKRVTAPGMVIGTPAYISPEQAQGHSLDQRTDIYSLGIVLYEMVTGKLPFNADDIMSLLFEHEQLIPPPPRNYKPDIPKGLEPVVLKALEEKPDQRWPDCLVFAEQLGQSLYSSGVRASSTNTPRVEEISSHKTDTQQSVKVSHQNQNPLTAKNNIKRFSLILADDHALLRRTLATYLDSQEQFDVISEAADGDKALEETIRLRPDMLILDLNMPGKGGLEVLPELRKQVPETKVLVLTGRDDDGYIVRALRSGAHGYILKSADESELVDSIMKVMAGQMVLGRGVAEKVVTGLLTAGLNNDKISDNEQMLLLYVAAGYSNEAISRKMNIPMTRVIELVASVMNKLRAPDRQTAALKALRDGSILLEDLHDIPAPDDGS